MMHHHHHQIININGGRILPQQDVMSPLGTIPKVEFIDSREIIRGSMDHSHDDVQKFRRNHSGFTSLNQKFLQPPPLWQVETKTISRSNS